MSSETPEGDVSAELRELGNNLKQAAQTVWKSEEGQRLQRELRTGFAALEAGLREAAGELSASPAGQRVHEEVHDFSERVRTGQVEERLRSDLVSALRLVNTELKKATRPAGDDTSTKV
jgi:hypothetical protein